MKNKSGGPPQNELTNVYIYFLPNGTWIDVPNNDTISCEPGSGECPDSVPHLVDGTWLMLGMVVYGT